MKKKSLFKYILVFLFIVLVIPILNAEGEDVNHDNNKDYLFYCDYDLVSKMYDYGDNTTPKFPLRAYVKEDKTVEFFYKDIKMKSNSLTNDYGYEDWGYYNTQITFDTKDFYKETKEGRACPKIVTQSLSNAGYVSITLFYYYDEHTMNDDSWNINEPKSAPIFNKNLPDDKKNNLENNVIKEIKPCEVSWYLSDSYKALKEDVGFQFYTNTNNDMKVKVFYGNPKGSYRSGEGIFSKNSMTEIRVKKASGEGYDIFYFYPEDYDIIFKQTESDIKNNTFTCPTIAPKIDKVKYPALIGSDEFVVAYSDKVLKENGAGDALELIEGDLDEIYKTHNYNYKVKVSSNKGVCTNYLGSASEDNTIANLLDDIYDIIKIGSIILVIVLSMLEFSGVITKSKDELMAAVKKLVTRLIILIILLLLPTFVDMLGNLFGIEDILCGIR